MKMRKAWQDLSVATKLYFVVGIMGLLIATELFTLRFAMHTLSSVRAFVGGEGLWSKGQKTSVIALRRYSDRRDERDYQAFQAALAVPLGDHLARQNLMAADIDMQKIYQGFTQGKIHHDDIDGLVHLVRRFYWVPHLAQALAIWAKADDQIFLLINDAEDLNSMIRTHKSNHQIEMQMRRIEVLNDDFTTIEDEFSYVLGEGSRWLEHVVMNALLLLVLTVEGTGVFLTVTFSRALSKSLRELAHAAKQVGQGNFSERLTVRSKDELGQLAEALNAMTKQLEETIGSRQQAERANEVKSAFLANMSHEIRTPMGAILGFADVLKDPSLGEAERTEFVGIIDRNGKALLKVIDDILDLSKVEAGALSTENLEFSLSALLEDVTNLFMVKATEKGIALKLDVDMSARAAVCTDPTRLRQILSNIVGNAIKFTAQGQVTISARIQRRSNRSNLIRIAVQDTGIGLSVEQRHKLFAPFAQADGSTTRKFGGSGLGLILSRKLAQALGGDVVIESSMVDKGTTMLIEIVDRSLGHTAQVSSAKASTQSETFNLSPKTSVLVVEDSPDIRALMRMILSKHGIKPDFASDGRQGVACALRRPYDVVLMDIQMPEMDGYQAVAELREKDYQGPIVALTAHAMKEEHDRSLELGFTEHLTKPVDETRLMQTIQRFAANV